MSETNETTKNYRSISLILGFSAIACALIATLLLFFLPINRVGYPDKEFLMTLDGIDVDDKEQVKEFEENNYLSYSLSQLLSDILSGSYKEENTSETEIDDTEMRLMTRAEIIAKDCIAIYFLQKLSEGESPSDMDKYDESNVGVGLLMIAPMQMIFVVLALLTVLITALTRLPRAFNKNKALKHYKSFAGAFSILTVLTVVFSMLLPIVFHALLPATLGLNISGVIAVPAVLAVGSVVLDVLYNITVKKSLN